MAGAPPGQVRASTPFTPAKSVSSEETLATDTSDRRLLHDRLLHHAEDVARQLRRLDLKARTITLKIKHADFQQVTRSKTLPRPIQAAESIFAQAETLLKAYALKKRVRLIGVGASHFVPSTAPVQAELFSSQGPQGSSWEKVDHTLDAIHAKFGRQAIRKAAFVRPPHKTSSNHRDPEE